MDNYSFGLFGILITLVIWFIFKVSCLHRDMIRLTARVKDNEGCQKFQKFITEEVSRQAMKSTQTKKVLTALVKYLKLEYVAQSEVGFQKKKKKKEAHE